MRNVPGVPIRRNEGEDAKPYPYPSLENTVTYKPILGARKLTF